MKVNEMFYSLQGEGANTGRPAIFVRFAGCNLSCDFCDTYHIDYSEASEEEIVKCVGELSSRCKFVVFTGGEPLLQLNQKLCDLLHDKGYTIAVESNGTIKTDLPIDWLTISPKHPFTKAKTIVGSCNEVKLLASTDTTLEQLDEIVGQIKAEKYYLQPIDTNNEITNKGNIDKTIALIKERPIWMLSLQTHKILKVR